MVEITASFRVRFARRLPDPIFQSEYGIERHILLCAVKDVPRDLSLDPNARTPNIRRRVYREVENSLLNVDCEENTFHLKNKGITIVARDVVKKAEDEYEVIFGEGDGVVDGGHTYSLILKNLDNPDLPSEQYVKFEILTKIPHEWVTEIAGGLNTSVQVQESSLLDLDKAFEWIKEELADEPYFSRIAWSENEVGDFDVRDLVSMMTCFNIDFFPNKGEAHPVVAYGMKSKALQLYKSDFENNDGESFKKLRPLLKDVLRLYDTIRYDFHIIRTRGGGRGGALKIVESREDSADPFMFPFIGKRRRHRLTRGALYPILAAFRWMVVEDPTTGCFKWRNGFDSVLERWGEVQERLVNMTVEKANEVGRKPDAIGKSRPHWGALHKEVAFVDLMK